MSKTVKKITKVIISFTGILLSLNGFSQDIEVQTGDSINIAAVNTNCESHQRVILEVETLEDGPNKEVKKLTSKCEARKCYVNFSSNIRFEYPYVGRWYDLYIELGSRNQLRKLNKVVISKDKAISEAENLVKNKICNSYSVTGAMDLTGPEKRFSNAVYSEENESGININ